MNISIKGTLLAIKQREYNGKVYHSVDIYGEDNRLYNVGIRNLDLLGQFSEQVGKIVTLSGISFYSEKYNLSIS